MMAEPPLLMLLAILLVWLLRKVWLLRLRVKRSAYIRTYGLPNGLLDRFGARYPHLSAKDRHLVARALRQFFFAYLKSGFLPVSMPSQVVDGLWHEFILYTRHYQSFCQQAFGRFLHHTPAVALGLSRDTNVGLRRVWWFACREEGIDPKNPSRLPLLFALDEQLGVAEGFRYLLDCNGPRRRDAGSVAYCVSDFSSPDVDGTTDGFGDSCSGGCGGGDGGGCGGD
jgi:hypothetical protein